MVAATNRFISRLRGCVCEDVKVVHACCVLGIQAHTGIHQNAGTQPVVFARVNLQGGVFLPQSNTLSTSECTQVSVPKLWCAIGGSGVHACAGECGRYWPGEFGGAVCVVPAGSRRHLFEARRSNTDLEHGRWGQEEGHFGPTAALFSPFSRVT